MAKEKLRQQLYTLLGDLPPDTGAPVANQLAVETCKNYVKETLTINIANNDKIPAVFLYPLQVEKPHPTILFNHSSWPEGKQELFGGPDYLYPIPYADELTKNGYAVLAIDALNYGERKGRTDGEIYKEMIWKGQVMWGKMVYDSLQAASYLLTRPDVDGNRIGTLGMSMGSTMSWWVAALDERIKVCVDICCLTDYHALIASRGLDGHGIYYYVPNLLKFFTTADINGLIAPRPHLSLAGEYDKLTPPEGLARIDQELKEIYAREAAAEAWQLLRYPVGHIETAEMRAEAIAFLKKWL